MLSDIQPNPSGNSSPAPDSGRRPIVRDVIIVSPFYAPAPGGASRYYSALSRQLVVDEIAESVTVFTEVYPGQPRWKRSENGRVTIRRIFPFRASNTEMSRWVAGLYFFQNLQLLTLPFRISPRHTIVLIHGYFHNKPGFIGLAVLLMRLLRASTSKVIVDLRDPRLPLWAIPTLAPYDALICCSQNVFDLISRHSRNLTAKASIIPIPFEVKPLGDSEIARVLQRYGLQSKSYIFSPNGIQDDKNIKEILDMVLELRRRGHRLTLVVAGRRRDWGDVHEKLAQDGVLMYLGSVSHKESLCLIAGSALVPVISPTVESISRTALEALALQTPVILPPNVPEFHRCCSDQIAKTINVSDLSDLAERLLGKENGDYDFGAHNYERTAALYLKLFAGSDANNA